MRSIQAHPWAWGAAGVAVSLALGLSWCIAQSPLTLYDGLGPILDSVRSASLADRFYGGLYSVGYWRPLRLAQIKAVVDLSAGNPIPYFTAVHVGLVGATFVLFAVWVRPRSFAEFTAAAIALTVLAGHHGFFVLFSEAYPINHFLEIVVLTLVVAVMARGDPRWWKDVLASLLLAIGALTLESGLLIGVAAAACRLVGWRGISWRGASAALVLVAAYFWIRFVVLGIPSPDLAERASGWWLSRLEAEEIARRFGAHPLPLYAYNVMAGLVGALLSEPKQGVWSFVRRLLDGNVRPWMAMQIVSSVLVTGAMVAALPVALSHWRRRVIDDRDRFVLLAFAMLAANAVLAFSYVKDEVLSVGVGFYAAGAFAVLAGLSDRLRTRRGAAAAVGALLLVATSVLWSARTVGTFFALQRHAYTVATDWAMYSLAQELPRDWDFGPTRQLFLELQRRNIARDVPHPAFTKQRYVDELLEVE